MKNNKLIWTYGEPLSASSLNCYTDSALMLARALALLPSSTRHYGLLQAPRVGLTQNGEATISNILGMFKGNQIVFADKVDSVDLASFSGNEITVFLSLTDTQLDYGIAKADLSFETEHSSDIIPDNKMPVARYVNTSDADLVVDEEFIPPILISGASRVVKKLNRRVSRIAREFGPRYPGLFDLWSSSEHDTYLDNLYIERWYARHMQTLGYLDGSDDFRHGEFPDNYATLAQMAFKVENLRPLIESLSDCWGHIESSFGTREPISRKARTLYLKDDAYSIVNEPCFELIDRARTKLNNESICLFEVRGKIEKHAFAFVCDHTKAPPQVHIWPRSAQSVTEMGMAVDLRDGSREPGQIRDWVGGELPDSVVVTVGVSIEPDGQVPELLLLERDSA